MPTYASPISGGKSNPQGFLKVFSKIFDQSGVLEANSLEVAAQLTPDMTVVVSGSLNNDNAIFILPNGHVIQAWNSSDVTIDIDPNSSGSSKTDAIVVYVDLNAYDAGNANNPGALKFRAVRGGSGSPSTGEIEADEEVGDNPYFVRAHVAVGNGVGVTPGTSINSGNITNETVRSYVDGQYLKPLSVGAPALAALSVTSGILANGAAIPSKLAPTVTTDAAGWKVYDFGTIKEYIWSQSFTSTSNWDYTVAAPTGLTFVTASQYISVNAVYTASDSDNDLTVWSARRVSGTELNIRKINSANNTTAGGVFYVRLVTTVNT